MILHARKTGGSPESESRSAETDEALIGAAEAGDFVRIGELLTQGANPVAINQFVRDALWCACQETANRMFPHPIENCLKVIAALISAGAEVNQRYPRYGNASILMEASELGATAAVQMLVERGADVSAIDAFGASALHRAALSGYAEIVKILVDAGAPVNLKSGEGHTPLRWAIEARQRYEELELKSGDFEKTIEILLAAGGSA